MLTDQKSKLEFSQSLAPAARNATANGTGVNISNYGAVTIEFSVGAITDGTHTPSVQESMDNSAWADASASLVGSLVVATANTIQKVAYVGQALYVRPKYTVSGATTGALCAATVIGGKVRKAPV